MTPTLRNWHRLLWPLLTLSMLGIGILAVKALPEGPTLLPKEEKAIAVKLLPASAEGSASVQLEVTEALSAATILVYLSPKATNDSAKGELLGAIEGRGQYQFPLSLAAKAFPEKYLMGYDPIYNKQIFLIQVSN